MDPNALWQMLRESLRDLNKWPNNADTRGHVVNCLEVLATWLRRGGFPPNMEDSDQRDRWQHGMMTHEEVAEVKRQQEEA
jgi:hypothetical protein